MKNFVFAVIVFVLALICLLAAAIYYAREVRVALSSVQEEALDLRFMDLEQASEVSELTGIIDPGDRR